VAAGKDMTRIDTDSETRIIDGPDKFDEFRWVTEHLGTLTSGRLKNDWTRGCGMLDSFQNIGPHCGQSFYQRLSSGLADVHHDTFGTGSRSVLEIFDEKAGMVGLVFGGGLGTQIDNVRTVNKVVAYDCSCGGELLIGDFEL